MYSAGNLLINLVFKSIPEIRKQMKAQRKIIEELFNTFTFIDNITGYNNSTDSKPYSVSLAGSHLDPYTESCTELYTKQYIEPHVELYTVPEKHFFVNKEYVQALYSLFPNVNSKKVINFMISFNMLTMYLDQLCHKEQIKDESTVRQFYLSMLDAVDPDREISNYCKYFPSKSENNYINQFVECCRNELEGIPSYKLVKENIKKYVYFYSDFHTYKHISYGENRDDYLFTWSGYYLGQYADIYPWEFQAAACSCLGIFALLSSAFDPSLTDEMISSIDKAYFPWINGLQVLLANYLCLYHDIINSNLNFTNYYKNLKLCEERIIFFFKQSLKACSQGNLSDNHLSVVNLILGIYLSDPRADLGLKKITSKNLIKSGDILYHRLLKLIMFLSLPPKYQCAYPY